MHEFTLFTPAFSESSETLKLIRAWEMQQKALDKERKEQQQKKK